MKLLKTKAAALVPLFRLLGMIAVAPVALIFAFYSSVVVRDLVADVYHPPGQPNPAPGVFHGYESNEMYGFIPGETYLMTVEARCTKGKKVLGGGFTLVSGGDWYLGSQGPSPDGAGYVLEIGSLSEEPQEVLVTAICAKVSK